jgi:hypothetical protein
VKEVDHVSAETYKGQAEVLSLEGQPVTSASVSLEVDAQGEWRVTAFSALRPDALGIGGEFLLRIEGRDDLRVRLSSAGPGMFGGALGEPRWRVEVLADSPSTE